MRQCPSDVHHSLDSWKLGRSGAGGKSFGEPTVAPARESHFEVCRRGRVETMWLRYSGNPAARNASPMTRASAGSQSTPANWRPNRNAG